MVRWPPEEMLLRRKVSSRLEVTESQTSGCHGDVNSDSLSVGQAGAGAGGGAVAGVSGLVSIPGPPRVFRRKCVKGLPQCLKG